MSELIFIVEEDPTGGLTAQALGYAIFTEAENRDDLLCNIREAVECHFGDDKSRRPSVIRLHFVRDEVFAL